MKTIRFYDLMIDVLENDSYSVVELNREFNLEMPVDFDLNDAFDILNEKSGCEVCSFRYEEVGYGS